jgi:hypothetical protein
MVVLLDLTFLLAVAVAQVLSAQTEVLLLVKVVMVVMEQHPLFLVRP